MNYYSTLWQALTDRTTSSGADALTTTYQYKGPHLEKQGSGIIVFFRYVHAGTALGTSDSLIICPLPKNCRVAYYNIPMTVATSSFDASLGYTGNAVSASAFGTALATGANTGVPMTVAGPTTASTNLILTPTTASIEAGGLVTGTIHLVIP